KSMQKAIDVTESRRERQKEYNKKHNITPTTTIRKLDKDLKESQFGDKAISYVKKKLDKIPPKEKEKILKDLKRSMYEAAKALEFEEAARLRDEIEKIKKL
ncbi:MAG: UvrB/UvrC motif-containing protein, partial [Campylobacterales bacterium]